MNRIEIVGLFSALKRLCDNKDYEGVEKIVDAVLDEAQYVKGDRQREQE